MTEQEFIKQESDKSAARLRRMLAHVTRTGFPSSRDADETLWGNSLTEFAGPDAAFPFNHYRLTPRALAFLETGVLPDPCDHCKQFAGHTLQCPLNPAWKEYDHAAMDLARRGLTGALGEPLPDLMTPDAVSLINADPEAFQERVRYSAYALAMAQW